MTIQDAIKSGKPFKRKDDDLYFLISPQFRHICVESESVVKIYDHAFDIEDILADDWETKEEVKEKP